MKKEIHPDYQDVLFVDTATGDKFLRGSTLKSDKTEKFQGKEYPVHRISISSASHPFFTGDQKFVDPEGRVGRFERRYATQKASSTSPEAAPEAVAEKKEKAPSKASSSKPAAKKTAPKSKTDKVEKKEGEA